MPKFLAHARSIATRDRSNRYWFLLLMLAATSAHAHIWLSPDIVSDAARRMQELQAQIKGSDARDEQAAGMFAIGDVAEELAELMNEEFAAHGAEQAELLLSAAEQAREAGVNILWSEEHQRFFYDGKMYTNYLSIVPSGAQAAMSRYRLILLEFYLGEIDNLDAMKRRAQTEDRFLRDFPHFGERERVGIFLGIDYRDISRLCKQREDHDCADSHARLALDQFRDVFSNGASDEQKEIARRLLTRFEDELARDPG